MLRPTRLAEFNGQEAIRNNLQIAITSAQRQNKPLGHMLFTGDAGLGKTTLASSVIPEEMGGEVKFINCAAVSKPQELTSTITLLKEGDFLFLDELHALPNQLRELLLTYMEDSRLSVTYETNGQSQVLDLELPKTTVLGATTRMGNLDGPLRSRFGHIFRLEAYTDEELYHIGAWHFSHKQLKIADEAMHVLARAARGTARTLVNLIESAIDTFMAADPDGRMITAEQVEQTLHRLGYQIRTVKNRVYYLSPMEWEYIMCFPDPRATVGLKTLSALLSESQQTVEEVYEPALLRGKIIQRTSGGRELLEVGHLIHLEERAKQC